MMTDQLPLITENHDTPELSEYLPCVAALACLEYETARRLSVLPVALYQQGQSSILVLACTDAFDLTQRERLTRHVHAEHVLQFIEYPTVQLVQLIAQWYHRQLSSEAIFSRAHVRRFDMRLTEAVHEFPVQLVNALLIQAAAMQASDVHLSPEASNLQVRLRIDGVLLTLASWSKALLSSLLVRIKIMASLDIAETRFPQDGQFRRVINGHSIDFRVSTFPTIDGENTVLRLIDSQRQRPSIAALNLSEEMEEKLSALMNQPEGLIVVCGPTGSGKSTTLFALLDSIDKQARSVMTLEDPVEQRMAGIRQTSIDASREWDYSQGLRALLRQDPDVLLIGEIRDSNSCRMSLRAVSTGHQVLTSVHAGSAHAALHRLRDLDAGEGALAQGLSAVIAQRLLRQRCTQCKGQTSSCALCHGTGYSGRQVIMELLEVTDSVRKLIARGADVAQISELSDEAGFVDLHQQAQKLLAEGFTTQEEIIRVLGNSPEEDAS